MLGGLLGGLASLLILGLHLSPPRIDLVHHPLRHLPLVCDILGHLGAHLLVVFDRGLQLLAQIIGAVLLLQLGGGGGIPLLLVGGVTAGRDVGGDDDVDELQLALNPVRQRARVGRWLRRAPLLGLRLRLGLLLWRPHLVLLLLLLRTSAPQIPLLRWRSRLSGALLGIGWALITPRSRLSLSLSLCLSLALTLALCLALFASRRHLLHQFPTDAPDLVLRLLSQLRALGVLMELSPELRQAFLVSRLLVLIEDGDLVDLLGLDEGLRHDD